MCDNLMHASISSLCFMIAHCCDYLIIVVGRAVSRLEIWLILTSWLRIDASEDNYAIIVEPECCQIELGSVVLQTAGQSRSSLVQRVPC